MNSASSTGDAATDAHSNSGLLNGEKPVGSGSGGLDLDLSGRQLGDYRLLRRLGRGAMADVYLAEQGSLRRQVAFKVLKRELAADETYVRRFHGEAQAAAALVQANIVQIYEVGCIEGFHYIAQEYVEGQNVSQYLARHGSMDVQLAVAVLRQVTAALCKAAERNIVHRDIKPENIMLARSGEVKVADFGLARVGAGEESLKLTQVGITMGTPLYMSPEQVEGRPLDPRSDVYSLGVTCYHMLAGDAPFRGDTALSVALQHVRTQPDRLENVRSDLPPALCRIIHRMLAKDPNDRYQSPRDLLFELRSLQIEGVDLKWPAELDEFGAVESAALGSASFAATQRLQAVMRTQSRLRQSRWIIYAAAVAIVALCLGGAAAWALRAPFLLDVPQTSVLPVDSFLTADRQFQYAQYRNDEAGWQSVIDNFDDSTWAPRAKEELALLYLKDDERTKAMALFEHMTKYYADLYPEYKVFGLAGQSIVLSLDGKPKESMQRLLELYTLLGGDWNAPAARQAPNNQLIQMLESIKRRNQKALGAEPDAKFKKVLDSLPEDANS